MCETSGSIPDSWLQKLKRGALRVPGPLRHLSLRLTVPAFLGTTLSTMSVAIYSIPPSEKRWDLGNSAGRTCAGRISVPLLFFKGHISQGGSKAFKRRACSMLRAWPDSGRKLRGTPCLQHSQDKVLGASQREGRVSEGWAPGEFRGWAPALLLLWGSALLTIRCGLWKFSREPHTPNAWP